MKQQEKPKTKKNKVKIEFNDVKSTWNYDKDKWNNANSNNMSQLTREDIREERLAMPEIKPFEIRDAKSGFNGNPEFKVNQTVSIYGKRGTGKSIWIKWFLHAYKDVFPWGWVFTKTKNNNFYQSFIPESKVLGPYNAFNLNRIMERQKDMIALYLRDGKTQPHAFVIWDDALDNDLKYDNDLHSYYFNSRHFMTMNLMSAQYVTGTPPPVRQNTDYAIIFKNENKKALDLLCEDFSCNQDVKGFEFMLQKTTVDRFFLLVNNDPNAQPEDKYMTGKAELIEKPFLMGCRQYWNFNGPQMNEILSGKFEDKLKRTRELAEIDKVVKIFDISNCRYQNDTV